MGEYSHPRKVVDISAFRARKNGTEMLEIVKDRLFTRWLRGAPELELAREFERPRPVVEQILRERAQDRIWNQPAQARRAA